MTKYYKGTLQSLKESQYYVGRINIISNTHQTWEPRRFNLPENIEAIIQDLCVSVYKESSNNRKMSTEERTHMDYFFNNIVNRQTQYPIIYERVSDSNGLVYGKELLTGLIFPLSDSSSHHHEYFIKPQYKVGLDFPCYKFYFRQNPQYHHDNYHQIATIVTNNELANQNDIDTYTNNFQVSFNHKYKLKSHQKKLSYYYKTNIFNHEPIFEEKQLPTLAQPEESLLMENIEYLLFKLSNYDQVAYQKYSLEYQNLLTNNSDLKVMPANITSLKLLEHKIKLALSDNKGNAINIIEYLTNLRYEYFAYFLTGTNSQTMITIDELDKLYENFLLIASDFDLMAQRQIFRNFSLIYLLEVKENLQDITKKELSNSYFSQNLKSIVITINALNDLGVIEPISIDLFHQLTLENVLHIISSIQFKQYEPTQVPELIKKLL